VRTLARSARAGLLLLLFFLLSACGVQRRVMGVFGADEGILLVRHNQPVAQVIRAGGIELGVALPGAIACFPEVPAGTLRLEARAVEAGTLTRATDIVLTAERPLLWDVDHLQVLDGRAYKGLCD
jgi:hypothetical protein